MYLGDKDIRRIRIYGKVISSVRYGAHLVWQAIRSCFGGGGWDNNQPWNNNDGWNNG